MDIDNIVAKALRRAETAMDHFEGVLRKSTFKGKIRYAVLPLLSRILEHTRAAHTLLKYDASAPVSIIVLYRAQYEAFLAYRYMLEPDTEGEREQLADEYIRFAEYEQVEAIGDRQEYVRQLSDDENRNFARRIAIHDEVKANLSKKQKDQGKYPTWNGLSIKKTAEELGIKGHDEWYGVTSMVAHSTPAMAHKSITWGEAVIMGQPQGGRKDGADWLRQISRVLSLAAFKLIALGGLELDAEDRRIFENVKTEADEAGHSQDAD